jgi:putative ubiquitin-RnfH superfamily antitoxin RatB of RatAB toxin-antitoxin module
MRISIRFACADLPDISGSREADVSDGATVEQAMVEYANLHQMEDTLEKLPESMFLIGRKPAQLSTALTEGDELMVMRILHGG